MRWNDNRASAATVGHGWIRPASIVLAMMGAGSTAHAGVPTVTEIAKLVPTDGMAQDQVGKSVAIEDETLVLGAPNYFADPNGPSSLYVFVRREAGQWEQFDRLFASDGVLGDALGESVAISMDTIIGGAPFKDDNGHFTGAAYVFVRDERRQWSEQAVIVPDDAVKGDRFGTAVALQGDTAVITAPSSGGTYVYERNDVGLWSQLIKLPDIGSSVAMQGDTLVIGRPNPNDPEAYVYVRDEERGWTRQVVLTPSDEPLTDFFGRSVAIDGDTIVVGATSLLQVNRAFVFTRTGDVWSEQTVLVSEDDDTEDNFGVSVAIEGDVILVGATHDGISGAVSVFTRSKADVWTEQVKLVPSDVPSSFGFAIDLDGGMPVVGSWADDANGPFSGSAYVFDNVTPDCGADTNGDGTVDFQDLLEVLAHWGPCSPDCGADTNDDGTVDFQDLLEVLAHWGACP